MKRLMIVAAVCLAACLLVGASDAVAQQVYNGTQTGGPGAVYTGSGFETTTAPDDVTVVYDSDWNQWFRWYHNGDYYFVKRDDLSPSDLDKFDDAVSTSPSKSMTIEVKAGGQLGSVAVN